VHNLWAMFNTSAQSNTVYQNSRGAGRALLPIQIVK
jgi:hypothetical protein